MNKKTFKIHGSFDYVLKAPVHKKDKDQGKTKS